MADAEDDDIGEPAPKRVHYGSLEEVERQRLLGRSGENGAGSMSAEIKAGIEAGHINVSARKLHTSSLCTLGFVPLDVREDTRLHIVLLSYHHCPCMCTPTPTHFHHDTAHPTAAESMERTSYANVAEQHKQELLDIFEARKKVS